MLAAGYAYSGVVVWTPSGCRLFSSLRQAPDRMPSSRSNSMLLNPNPAANDATAPAFPPPLTAKPLPPQLQRLSIGDGSWALNPNPGLAAGGMTPEAALASFGNASLAVAAPSHLVPPAAAVGPLEGGVSTLAWGPGGYTLTVGHVGCAAGALHELQFAQALPHHHRVAHAPAAPPPPPAATSTAAAASSPYGWGGAFTASASSATSAPAAAAAAAAAGSTEELFVLQAHDRLLLVSESPQGLAAVGNGGVRRGSGGGGGGSADGGGGGESSRGGRRRGGDGRAGSGSVQRDSAAAAAQLAGEGAARAGGSELQLTHLLLPPQYLAVNWPVRHVAVGATGADIAVAGRCGLALYSRAQDR